LVIARLWAKLWKMAWLYGGTPWHGCIVFVCCVSGVERNNNIRCVLWMGRSKSPKNGTTLRVSHFHNTTNTCNQPTFTMVPEPRLASKHRRPHTQNNPYIPMQQRDVFRFFCLCAKWNTRHSMLSFGGAPRSHK
jgi:hypothetical protein